MRLTTIGILLLLASLSAQTSAQDPVVVIRPGDDDSQSERAAVRAVQIFNRSGTTRIFGSHTVRRNDIYGGDVGIYDGTLSVSGIVEGDLVAIDSDVRLRSSAEIRGDILIIGGSLDRSAGAHVGGVMRRYRRTVEIRRDGDELDVVSRRYQDYRVSTRDRYRPRFTSADASIALGLDLPTTE